MVTRVFWLISVLCLLVPIAAAKTPAPDARQGDGRVSTFYTWKRAVPLPGRILRTEPLPPGLGLSNAARQVRILYSSTDGVGGAEAVAVSGVLFLPEGSRPAEGWPLVAWAHGTVGVADICAPSWAGRSLRDVRYLNAWLAAGFAIVATDYQGLGTPGPHPYLYTKPVAYGVLDSARAVLRAHRFGLSGKVVLVGQSQGGIGVIATGGYAREYAPELDIRAIVATGAGSDRVDRAQMPRRDMSASSPLVGYLPFGMLTAQQREPSLGDDDVLTESAIGLMEIGRRSCFPAVAADAVDAGLSFANALQPGAAERLNAINGAYISYPTYSLRMPLFIGSGEADQDVPLPMHAALAREACAAGTLVEWHIYRGFDHGGAVNASLRHSLPFVRRALAGNMITPRCVAEPE